MNAILQRCLIPMASLVAKRPDFVLSLRYRKALGRRIETPPHSFHDKLFWMSVYTDTTLWTELSDKVKVRSYVSARCGDSVLTKLYATYSDADEIDFSTLPQSFAIKTNNGCGTNYLVRSKDTADLEDMRKVLRRWLSFPYGELTGQLHYARISPQILAEELLVQDDNPDAALLDYKFYCFDGVPRYCYVVSERQFDQRHSHRRMIYDMDWTPIPYAFKEGENLSYVERPETFPQMVDVVTRLSKGIPFVRTDLYEVNNHVKFGEMTFLPGMHHGYTESFQRKLGDMITLPPDTLQNRAKGV